MPGPGTARRRADPDGWSPSPLVCRARDAGRVGGVTRPLPAEPDVPGPYGDDAAVAVPVADPVGADPDAAAEPDAAVEVFPPVLDVGPLPEPVDGFPWIDTGSLGVADPAAVPAAPAAPTAQDLAGYAAADLPPGVDPWAALEASDDPATAALARFYRPGDTSPDS